MLCAEADLAYCRKLRSGARHGSNGFVLGCGGRWHVKRWRSNVCKCAGSWHAEKGENSSSVAHLFRSGGTEKWRKCWSHASFPVRQSTPPPLAYSASCAHPPVNVYYRSSWCTSSQLAESFLTVPFLLCNSHGKPVYIGPASALHPDRSRSRVASLSTLLQTLLFTVFQE